MLFFYVLTWWIVGIAAMLWVIRDRRLTWADLLWSIVFGVFGPAIALIIGVVALAHADFWSEPVFKTRRKCDRP